MTRYNISQAISNISSEYIEEAESYSATKNTVKFKALKILAVAAALCLVAVIFIPWDSNKAISTPFVLTAYAMDDTQTISNLMIEGESVPVSLFETTNGLKGFVFSYDKGKSSEVSSISVMTEGNIPSVIDEIVGLQMSDDKHYIIYIPDQTKDFPYKFMIPYDEANMVYFCYLVVEKTDNGCIAMVERTESFERVMK